MRVGKCKSTVSFSAKKKKKKITAAGDLWPYTGTCLFSCDANFKNKYWVIGDKNK